MPRYTIIFETKNNTLTITGNLGIAPLETHDEAQDAPGPVPALPDGLLSQELQPNRLLEGLADVAHFDAEENRITAQLVTLPHFLAMRSFLSEHYDMSVTMDERTIYDAANQSNRGKESLLDKILPRFIVMLGTDGALVIFSTENESLRTFFDNFPFEKSLSNVRYDHSEHAAYAKLATLNDYKNLRSFVSEMPGTQIRDKASLLKQIDQQIAHLSSSTTAVQQFSSSGPSGASSASISSRPDLKK